MPQDNFRVNGKQISWPDVICKVAGKEFVGLSGVSYGQKRERVKAYGMGRHYAPRGRTRGKYSADNPKLTFYKGSGQKFLDLLASLAPDGVSYGNVEFPMVIQYVADDESPIQIEFLDCCVAAETATDDESPDPSKDEIELDVMKILRNGKSLFDSTHGAP
jgi:hypothetical protein